MVDLPRTIERVAVSTLTAAEGRVPIMATVQPTNGVTYLRGIRATTHLPEELKPYLPLYAQALTWMGTRHRSKEAYAQDTEMCSGGITVSAAVTPSPEGPFGSDTTGRDAGTTTRGPSLIGDAGTEMRLPSAVG